MDTVLIKTIVFQFKFKTTVFQLTIQFQFSRYNFKLL